MFGPAGDEPLDPAAAHKRLSEIADVLPSPKPLADIARGFLAIANDGMANAIRKISVARGHDVTGYALACFGGAGGQHACSVADELGIETVLVHPLAGILSAYGIGLAPVKAIRETSLVRPLLDGFEDALAALETEARAALTEQDIAARNIEVTPRARLRFDGSDSVLTVACEDTDAMAASFRTLHRQRYGYSDDAAAIIVEALSVEAIGKTGGLASAPIHIDHAGDTASGDWQTYNRGALRSGQDIAGPALVIDPGSTTVIDEGWQGRLADEDSLVLTRTVPVERQAAAGTAVDPMRLEIFNNLFMALAEEMGVVLQNTATSVNIKERLDFSCALFDRSGALIANAPHIPVHLGSMGDSVARVIEARGLAPIGVPHDERGIRRGDAYVVNDPFRGGTHLPDITVIAPVFYNDDSAAPDAFVAGVIDLSDGKRQELEQELIQAKAERTRPRTSIDRLLGLIEEGIMKPGDPEFAARLSDNRTAVTAMTSRIDVLESQLARGSRKITPAVLDKFSKQLSEKLRDEDSSLRSAYLRMLVSKVEVSDQEVIISGSKMVLERWLAKGLPRLEGSVPIFDQQWCPWPDSNRHFFRNSILSRTRLPIPPQGHVHRRRPRC